MAVSVVVVAVFLLIMAFSFGLVDFGKTSSVGPGSATVAGSVTSLALDVRVYPGGNGTFVVYVNETNQLNDRNNVTVADRWPLQRAYFDPYDGCGAYYTFPIGFVVFQGYYGLSNYTTGKPLVLYDTNYATSCTTNMYPVTSYLFNPSSDIAQSFSAHGASPGLFPVSQSLTITGYWTGGAGTGSPAKWHGFHGTYTIVAADEWGAVVIRHFSVLSTA